MTFLSCLTFQRRDRFDDFTSRQELFVIVLVIDSCIVSTLGFVLPVDRWSNMRPPMATQHPAIEDEDDYDTLTPP